MAFIPSHLLKMPRLAGVRVVCVYLLVIICYATIFLFLFIRQRIDQTASNISLEISKVLIDIAALLILSWGCLRLNKIAYCLSVLFIANQALPFLFRLPSELLYIRDTAIWLAKSDEVISFGTSGFYTIGFYLMAFTNAALRIVALILLLLPTTIKAFFPKKQLIQA